MQKSDFVGTLESIIKEDPRYDREAYIFVREGLDYTLKLLQKRGEVGHRHVSGQELLEGLRRYTLDQFGPMSKTVLNYWGIAQCEDFAEIVFNLVNKGVLGKTEQDSRDDFKASYNFDEAFVKPFLPVRPDRFQTRPRSAEPSTAEPPRPRLDADPKKLSSGSN